MRSGAICSVTGALVCAMTFVSQAAVYEFAFEGNVDSIFNNTGAEVNVQPGDRFIFIYRFDSDAPHNQFNHSCDGISSSLQVGGLVFGSLGVPNITVQHDFDQFSVFSDVVLGLPQLKPTGRAGVYLGSMRNDIFVNDSLPTQPPDFTEFSTKDFSVTYLGAVYDRHLQISGTVDASYVVPEPATMVFVALASSAIRGKCRTC